MKKLFLPTLLLIIAISAGATGFKSVLVTLTDGSTSQINLSEDLKTTFDETNIIFSDDSFRFEIEKTNVEKFEFLETAGIGNARLDAETVTLESGILSLNGLPEKSKISIYTPSGKCISETVCSGNCNVDLNELPSGIYIAKINNVSFKIALSK